MVTTDISDSWRESKTASELQKGHSFGFDGCDGWTWTSKAKLT